MRRNTIILLSLCLFSLALLPACGSKTNLTTDQAKDMIDRYMKDQQSPLIAEKSISIAYLNGQGAQTQYVLYDGLTTAPAGLSRNTTEADLAVALRQTLADGRAAVLGNANLQAYETGKLLTVVAEKLVGSQSGTISRVAACVKLSDEGQKYAAVKDKALNLSLRKYVSVKVERVPDASARSEKGTGFDVVFKVVYEYTPFGMVYYGGNSKTSEADAIAIISQQGDTFKVVQVRAK